MNGPAKRPNILHLLSDQHSPFVAGCYGDPVLQTPNLDRLAARGVVFGIVGGFLLLAALRTSPGEARGVGGALKALQQQPFGPWLLGVVALGLIAYGIFELVKARYRRITPA